MNKIYLVLEDGSVFPGEAFGASAETVGELVFTTGMTGWAENLADPRFAGQIVLETFPLVGCAGISAADFEKPICAAGFVVRSHCAAPSNFRADHTLDEYLKKNGIPGISGVDTREITRILREKGTMSAKICGEIPADAGEMRMHKAENPMKTLKTARGEYPAAGTERCRVVLMDYGTAVRWIEPLTARGCRVILLSHDADAAGIAALQPDGVFLSGGGGNPSENTEEIAVLSAIVGKYPLFAVGLGCQMLALSQGAKTVKLPHGHRGTNHPVRDIAAHRTYITEQNHGYAVDAETVTAGTVGFVSANDGTVEGILYPDLCAVGVQFTPHTAMIDAFVQKIAEKGGQI